MHYLLLVLADPGRTAARGRGAASGRAGRWSRLSRRRHHRSRGWWPSGGQSAYQDELDLRRHLPVPVAAAVHQSHRPVAVHPARCWSSCRTSRPSRRPHRFRWKVPHPLRPAATPRARGHRLRHRSPSSRHRNSRHYGEDFTRGDRMTDRPAFVLLEDGTWYPGTTLRPLDSAFGRWSSPRT